MKLVTKYGHVFATGMFWQVPDEGKRKINLGKLVKDTKHNMFCQIRTINPTWGFCHRDEMMGYKKVSSLGKFIIETSKLSANYANSIICFKFKSSGEPDDNGKILSSDLYGYIVLLNGTICPDEGEYVSGFEMIRESILVKAKKYEIETLYLPIDVAGQFFSIFEILSDAFSNEQLLTKVIVNLNVISYSEIKDFIINNFTHDVRYNTLLDNDFNLAPNLELVGQLIREPLFEQKVKEVREQNLKYLIPNIYILPLDSEEIYWKNTKFKHNVNNSLILPISKQTNQKYKLTALIGLLGFILYLCYILLMHKDLPLENKPNVTPIAKAISVNPSGLINVCITKNDRFFKDLGIWTFISLKCNSLGATLTFNSDVDSSILQFSQLIGKTGNIKLAMKTGIYTISYRLPNEPKMVRRMVKDQIIDNLQKSAITYGFKLVLAPTAMKTNTSTKFSILSKQSPLFLLNRGVFENVRLNEISMNFDKSSGFYSWISQGDF